MDSDSTLLVYIGEELEATSGSPTSSRQGGVFVPRNVEATRNVHNPKRSILLTYDAPEQGPPDKYKIVAIPDYGKKKTFFCKTNTMLIEYLRKGIEYKFEVHASYGGEWSEGCLSNYQQTDGEVAGDGGNNALVSISDTGNLNLNMSGAEIHGHWTNVSMPKGDSFGKVRDLGSALSPLKNNEKAILTLTWKVPTFSNNAPDYKVENYRLEIRKNDTTECEESSIDFDKNLDKYSIRRELDFGETYKISVSTTYTDIDQDVEYTSNAEKTTVQTQPCKPTGIESKVIENDVGEKALQIEWNAVKGANQYEVGIYTDASAEVPHYIKNVGTKTTWQRTFDDGLGYGTSYYAVVTAIREENKTNFTRTDWEAIEPEPPTLMKVEADRSVKGILVMLKDDFGSRKSYEVCAVYRSQPKRGKIVKTAQEHVELEQLIPGASYQISAATLLNNMRSKTVTFPNLVQTYPDTVENLRSKQDGRIIVYEWDPLEIKPDNYKVQWRVDNDAVQVCTTRETRFELSFVNQGVSYWLRVTAMNSAGNGEESGWVAFKTDAVAQGAVPSAHVTKTPKKYTRDEEWKKIDRVNIWYQEDKPMRRDTKVFEAKREDVKGIIEEIVVKFIPVPEDDPKLAEKNKKEVAILKKLVGRSNVVTYFQCGYHKFRGGRAIFIAIERCETETLHDKIEKSNDNCDYPKRKGDLEYIAIERCETLHNKPEKSNNVYYDYPKRKRDLRCIAKGLQYLKENQIIHRDLKPHNILFRSGFPVISDFGLSKMHPEAKSNTLQSRQNIGTRGWVAPEAWPKGGKVSYASDTFAAGLVFFYVWTGGKHPFSNDEDERQTFIGLWRDKKDGFPCNLEPLCRTPDGVLAFDMIESMLSMDPKDRPSIEAVLEHPFFWDEVKRINFLFDCQKVIESVKKQVRISEPFSSFNEPEKYEFGHHVKTGRDWRDELETCEYEIDKIKKGYEPSLSELLRYIRNANGHPKMIKKESGEVLSQTELCKFFSAKFPHFFIYVYHWFKHQYTEDKNHKREMVSLLYRYQLIDRAKEAETPAEET